MAETRDVAICDVARSRLIVVDSQVKLAGAMSEAARERLIGGASLLLQAAARLEVPVLVTEQYPKGLGPTEPAIAEHIPASAQRFEKTKFSCCGAAGFTDAVCTTSRPQAVITGIEAHICVLRTALDLHAAGVEVFVVEDAVASRNDSNVANAMARLRQAGVVVTNAESVIFEWLTDSQHEAFKEITTLLR